MIAVWLWFWASKAIPKTQLFDLHYDNRPVIHNGSSFSMQKMSAIGQVSYFLEPGDQIETDIPDASLTQNGHGLVDIRAAMHAAGGLELSIDKRLRAKTDAIDSVSDPECGLFRFDRFGIGLKSDFLPRTVVSLAYGAQKLAKKPRVQEAWRTTADIDRVHGFWGQRQLTQRLPIEACWPGDTRGAKQGRMRSDFALNSRDIRREPIC